MASPDVGHMNGRSKECAGCHQARKICRYTLDGTKCTRCERTESECVPLASSKKRKNEAIEISSDCELERSDRDVSSTTLMFNEPEREMEEARHRRIRKKPRASSAQFPGLRSSRTPAPQQSSTENEDCGLCKKPHRANAQHRADRLMIACDICGIWYHVTCLWFSKISKPMIWFSPATGEGQSQEASQFICPKCLDPSEDRHRAEDLSKKLAKIREMLSGDHEPVPTGPQIASIAVKVEPEVLEHAQKTQRNRSLEPCETDEPVFQPTKYDRYEGFGKGKIEDLVRRLDHSLLNYSREVKQSLDDFPDINTVLLQNPLKEWERIDPAWCEVSGREWYTAEGLNTGPGPTPLTAGLRRILGVPHGEALEIHSNLHVVSFSQVHKGLVALFVSDIVNNKLRVDEWHNMKAVRAMLPAIKNFADERWNRKGRHVLREIRLRAFYNGEFQKEILIHRERLASMMESYMEPLTGSHDNIDSWNFSSLDLMEDTLILCFYLHALGAKIDIIQPRIGDSFDPELHQVDEGECEPDPLQSSHSTVRWVLRPGFRCEEIGVDGHRSMIIEALVMV